MNFHLDSHGSAALQREVVHHLLGGNTAQMSMLDLGCGEATAMQHMPWGSADAVDLVDEPARPRNYAKFHQVDVLGEHPVFERKYDAVLCMDCIEHLVKEDGLRLLERMRWMLNHGGTAVVFTPFGFLKNDVPEERHTHKSGWDEESFPTGWKTLVFANWHHIIPHGALFAYCKNT